jgi:hypothetical protein
MAMTKDIPVETDLRKLESHEIIEQCGSSALSVERVGR